MAGEAAKAGADKVAETATNAISPNSPTPTPPTPPPPPPPPSPAEVCANVVGALRTKDDAKLTAVSTPASGTALAAKESKEHVVKLLAEGTCGMAKVEEDKATVTVTTGGQPVDVAFVKLGDGWKFDAVTFLEKNPAKAGHPAGKKGKEAHAKPKHKK